LIDTLIPRVNAILDELGNERQGTVALGWEVHIANLPIEVPDLMIASLTPTRHWAPILAIAALIVSYSITIRDNSYSPSPTEMALIFLNLILLVWATVQNTIVARALMQRARRSREDDNRVDEEDKPKKRIPNCRSYTGVDDGKDTERQ
jgi:hypothetical protein